jgi:diadenosine tetraphosphate (Ap4A) HIT family hydrolase
MNTTMVGQNVEVLPGSPFLEEPRLQEWEHWAIIPNAFPYSAAFSVHHMLIPKRVASWKQLKSIELQELQSILDQIETMYDSIMVNFPSKQSVVTHYHMHLLTFKEKRKELKL